MIAVVASITMHALGVAVLAPLIALYTIAATRERRVSVAAGVTTLAALTADVAAGTPVLATVDRVGPGSPPVVFALVHASQQCTG